MPTYKPQLFDLSLNWNLSYVNNRFKTDDNDYYMDDTQYQV